jgi:uncharacterized repeat protein (TIGR01451 family)
MILSEIFVSWRTRTAARRISLCAFLLSGLAGPEVLSAHEEYHTHTGLAAASLQLLVASGNPPLSIDQKAHLLQGVIDEDQCGCPLYHFYNPRTHENHVAGVIATTSARERAERLWHRAIGGSVTSGLGCPEDWRPACIGHTDTEAFKQLGHVLHLLQDMTSPAHVHDDAHANPLSGCNDADDFENWGWCSSTGSNRITNYVNLDTDGTGQVNGGTMTDTMNSIMIGFLHYDLVLPIDLSPGGFIHDLANRTYDFTTYSGRLQVGTTQQDSDLREMFPSLAYNFTLRGWSIADGGMFYGSCGGNQGDDWWGMEESCTVDGSSRISGNFYIENSGGTSNSLIPAVWKKEGAHPTGQNSLPLLEIYGDTLYPLATAYGAGLLKVYEVATKPVPFTDVQDADWFAGYVRYMLLQGVIQGFQDGTFRPNNTATRAEALQMAYKGAGEDISPIPPNPGFADVNPADWFYRLVADAKAKSFVTGVPCGSQQCFNPNEAVSRAEAAKLVSILLKVDINHLNHVINSTPIPFSDVQASDWFYLYVYWLTSSKLENGFNDLGLPSGETLLRGYSDGKFHPEWLVTRAEMAKLLTNTMLYCRASTRGEHECGPQTTISGSQASSKLLLSPRVITLGALYEQVADPTNHNAPAPFHLPGGDQQTVTGPLTFNGVAQDADGDALFYFWTADGGSFTTSDPVSFSRVTWTPPTVAVDRVFTIHVVRGDRRGLVGTGTFEFLVPGTNSPGSGTITSPNGTQTGTVTVGATASDPEGLARVSVTFVAGGPELVLCGSDGPSPCGGASGTYSRTGVNPAAFGAASGTVTLSLFVQDATGDVRVVDSHGFTFNPPPSGPTFKLTILKRGDGSGTVSGSAVVCGPTCTSTNVNLPQGSSVTLTGSAAAGSVFVGFAGDPCYGTDPCVFTMFADRKVYASFGFPDAFAVLFTTPANGDTGVSVTAQPYLMFNRDLQAGPSFASLVLREAGGTPVPFTPVIRSTDRRLFLLPTSSLKTGLSYVVEVPTGAVTDTQGSSLSAPVSFTFTTAVAGTPKMYLTAQPRKVMEGSQTQASLWFEAPVPQDRVITLASTPAGELIHPSQVTLPAGQVLVEFPVTTRNNPGSTTATTATLSAATAGVGQQSVTIEIENQTSLIGSSLKWQAAGIVDETNHNGIFESGETADIRFDVANFGSSTVSGISLTFAVLNTNNLRILGGAPFTCNINSLMPGRNGNCTRSFAADPALPTGEYFVEVKGVSNVNNFLATGKIHVVNNSLPDFALSAGSFPSADLQPGATVDLRYTAKNLGDGFSTALPFFEVTLDLNGTQSLLYRIYAEVRGDDWNDQFFRLPLVVPPGPGPYTIRARINPPGTGRLTESDYTNNDAAELILHVAAPNQAPVLNPIPVPLAAKVGRILTFTATATDPNGDPITYRLGAGSPTGALIGPSTGIFEWTPQCGEGPATYTFPVIAQDSIGAMDTKTVTVDVGLEADLGITQTFSSPLAVPGETVAWTVQAVNHGPSCLTGVLVADAFPSSLVNVQWTCSATTGSSCAAGQVGAINDASVTLTAGGTATYTVSARIADTASGLLVNTATVSPPASAIDPNGTDNSALASLTLRGMDFGDAPSAALGAAWTFPTRLVENGARHGIHPELRLGVAVDAEPDGQPSLAASGDDAQGARDEDGVVPPAQLVACQTAAVQVTASATGFLDAWIDFNTDGDWADAGEHVATRQPLAAGGNTLSVAVPCTATPGGTAFARFRFSSTGGLSPSGLALDGEVEDHALPIFDPRSACADSMEAGPDNWRARRGPLDDGLSTGWNLAPQGSHSPVRSWTVPGESRVKDQLLVSRFPMVIGTGPAELRFWHRVSLPGPFAGGVLEVSVSGGQTWSDVLAAAGTAIPANPFRILANGYTSTLSPCCSNPLAGRDAWSDDSTGWQEVVVDLSDFAGQSVLFRWRLASSVAAGGGGWWIDDVTVVGATSCPFQSLFSNGFESGNLSDWQGFP